MRLAEELYLFEPFGVKNPVPLFYLKDAYVADESLVGGGKHTRLLLKKGDVTVTAMCFRKSIGELDIYPGDTVDALFNLDVNEFGGMRNLQMIVRDVRLAERQAAAEEREKEIYDAVTASKTAELGLTAEEKEACVPDRDDFAAVYSVLTKELRFEHKVFSIRALRHLLMTRGVNVSYVKLKTMIMVFRELNLIGVEEAPGVPDVFSFSSVTVKNKTTLDKSGLLKKIRNELRPV